MTGFDEMNVSTGLRGQKAAGAILLAMAIIGFIDNFVGQIAEDAGLWQFHLVRSLISLPMLFALLRVFGMSWRPKRWRPVLLRTLIYALGLLIYFGCLGILPVSQAAAGLFTSPMFVLLFSTVFFGVRVGTWRVLAMFVGFAGVLMVLRPETGALSLISFVPITAGSLYAIAMLATRHWCADENIMVLTIGSFAALGVMGAVGLLAASTQGLSEGVGHYLTSGWVSPTPRFLWLCLLQAVGSVAAVLLITWGYKTGDASFIAVFEYSFLIFAAFWGLMLWGNQLDFWSMSGMALIIFSGITISLRSRRPVVAPRL